MSVSAHVRVLLAMPKGGFADEFVPDQADESVGIGVLASSLKAHGVSVEAIHGAGSRSFRRALQRTDPAVVGLSATWANLARCLEFAKVVRLEYPNTLIIIGGAGASFCAEQILRGTDSVDAVVEGEGHETIVELAAADRAPSRLRGVRGIVFRDGSRLVRTPPRSGLANLQQLPRPDRTWFRQNFANFGAATARILGTWGCGSRCTFCVNPEWCARFRPASAPRRLRRTPDDVLDEVSELARLGARTIIFADEDAIGRSDADGFRIDALVEGLRRLPGQALSFSAMTTTDGALERRQQLSQFAEVGLRRVFLGVENLCNSELRRLGASQKTSPEHVALVCRYLQERHVFCMQGFMLFNPWTKASEVIANIRALRLIPGIIAPYASALFRRAELYPGNALYSRYLALTNHAPHGPLSYRFEHDSVRTASDFLLEVSSRVFVEDAQLWNAEAEVTYECGGSRARATFDQMLKALGSLNLRLAEAALRLSPGCRAEQLELFNRYMRERATVLRGATNSSLHSRASTTSEQSRAPTASEACHG